MRLQGGLPVSGVVVSILLLDHRLVAQSPATPASQPVTTQPATTQPADPQTPPPYKALRYDEDYGWLDAPPGTYRTDFTDRLKNIHLGDDWRLNIGGEIRGRYELERNRDLLNPEHNSDTYFLHRYFLHADLRYRDILRVFLEGQETLAEEIDLNPNLATWEDQWDVKQAFFDVRPLGSKTPLNLRAGRQEFLYGRQRLIGPLGWANVQRRFDALKLMYQSAALDVDAFWGRPVDTAPQSNFDIAFDHPDEDTDFLGLYATYKKIPNHKLEAYFLTLLRNMPPANANGLAEQLQIYTIGTRAEGRTGDWDYEGELAMQTGEWGGDQVGAWMLAAETGYTLAKIFATPRAWIAFDYASGDANAFDDKHGTFNQLFPTGHMHLGYADMTGRQNIIDSHLGVSIQPTKQLFLSAEQHFFALAERTDALYSVTGSPTRRDRTGRSGRFVGHEIDLIARYTLDRHTSVEVGYSHFEAGGFLQSSGPERPVEFFYVQYHIRF
jgi:hypothetical protein